MTIEELQKQLKIALNSGFQPTDKVMYRQLDKNGKLFHDVDYFVTHEKEPNALILCEDWL